MRKQSDRRRVTACLGSRRNGMVSDAGLRTQVLRGGRAVLLVRFWRDYVAFSLHPHPRRNNKSSFRFPLRADKRGRNPPVIRKWGHATPTVLFKRTWLGQPLTQLLCYQSQTTVLRRQKKNSNSHRFPNVHKQKTIEPFNCPMHHKYSCWNVRRAVLTPTEQCEAYGMCRKKLGWAIGHDRRPSMSWPPATKDQQRSGRGWAGDLCPPACPSCAAA